MSAGRVGTDARRRASEAPIGGSARRARARAPSVVRRIARREATGEDAPSRPRRPWTRTLFRRRRAPSRPFPIARLRSCARAEGVWASRGADRRPAKRRTENSSSSRRSFAPRKITVRRRRRPGAGSTHTRSSRAPSARCRREARTRCRRCVAREIPRPRPSVLPLLGVRVARFVRRGRSARKSVVERNDVAIARGPTPTPPSPAPTSPPARRSGNSTLGRTRGSPTSSTTTRRRSARVSVVPVPVVVVGARTNDSSAARSPLARPSRLPLHPPPAADRRERRRTTRPRATARGPNSRGGTSRATSRAAAARATSSPRWTRRWRSEAKTFARSSTGTTAT